VCILFLFDNHIFLYVALIIYNCKEGLLIVLIRLQNITIYNFFFHIQILCHRLISIYRDIFWNGNAFFYIVRCTTNGLEVKIRRFFQILSSFVPIEIQKYYIFTLQAGLSSNRRKLFNGNFLGPKFWYNNMKVHITMN